MSLLITISLLFGAGTEIVRPGSAENVQRDRIAALIRQLGDKEYAKREAARKALDTIGEPALEALEDAAESDKDAEVRHRAMRIIRAIKSRLPAAPEPIDVQYVSDTFSVDLPLAESKQPVHRVFLEGRLANRGKVTLTLDPNVPKFDRFGDQAAGRQPLSLVKLACTLRLAKVEKARQLWKIRGPKIVSRLSLVTFSFDAPWGDGRLLVHDRNGEVRYVIGFIERNHRVPPCHPGCFPAGTQVLIPRGKTTIERIRKGDLVSTVDAAGKLSSSKVVDVFTVRNRVLEVRTDSGILVTTTTQPVALIAGGFRAAGSLKAGDRVWRWAGGKHKAVTVKAVTAATREAEVFNLVLGEPTRFIAGGFLVRSKPPPPVPQP